MLRTELRVALPSGRKTPLMVLIVPGALLDSLVTSPRQIVPPAEAEAP
jgi:hypothetical protein